MPWACKLGEKSIRLEDLDIGVLEDFASAHGTEWVNVVFTPFQNLRTARALVELCAEQMNVDPPTEWTARIILDAFDDVPDDLPEQFDGDGRPLTVVAETGTPS